MSPHENRKLKEVKCIVILMGIFQRKAGYTVPHLMLFYIFPVTDCAKHFIGRALTLEPEHRVRLYSGGPNSFA